MSMTINRNYTRRHDCDGWRVTTGTVLLHDSAMHVLPQYHAISKYVDALGYAYQPACGDAFATFAITVAVSPATHEPRQSLAAGPYLPLHSYELTRADNGNLESYMNNTTAINNACVYTMQEHTLTKLATTLGGTVQLIGVSDWHSAGARGPDPTPPYHPDRPALYLVHRPAYQRASANAHNPRDHDKDPTHVPLDMAMHLYPIDARNYNLAYDIMVLYAYIYMRLMAGIPRLVVDVDADILRANGIGELLATLQKYTRTELIETHAQPQIYDGPNTFEPYYYRWQHNHNTMLACAINDLVVVSGDHSRTLALHPHGICLDPTSAPIRQYGRTLNAIIGARPRRDLVTLTSTDQPHHTCVKCFGPAKLMCGKCKRVYYCAPACQRSDHVEHRAICISPLITSVSADARLRAVDALAAIRAHVIERLTATSPVPSVMPPLSIHNQPYDYPTEYIYVTRAFELIRYQLHTPQHPLVIQTFTDAAYAVSKILTYDNPDGFDHTIDPACVDMSSLRLWDRFFSYAMCLVPTT